MILFDSKLPIRNEVTPDQIHKLCAEWVGAHNGHRIPVPEYNGTDGEFSGRRNSQLVLKHFRIDGKLTVSYRLRQRKNTGEEWLVDILYFSDEIPKYVQIQLSCNRTDGMDVSSNVKPPNILKMFLTSGLCDLDSDLSIQPEAYCAENHMELCSEIMSGITPTFLPAVYVSCDDYGETAIDAKMLAERLWGIAHVFVETAHETGWRMKSLSCGRNAHHGYIGLYLSDPFAYTFVAPEDGVISVQKVETALRKFYLNRSVSIRNHLYLKQLCSENAGIGELNELLLTADQELEQMDRLKRKNSELMTKVNGLIYENESLKQFLKEKQSDKLFYNPGREPELYQGERNDLLFYALAAARKNSKDDSRKAHLIDDLLCANPEIGTYRQLSEDLSRIFRPGDNLNEHTIAQLQALGFQLKSDNSHYKFVFGGDNRYTMTVPKTGSDHRGFKNMLSTIKNLIGIE